MPWKRIDGVINYFWENGVVRVIRIGWRAWRIWDVIIGRKDNFKKYVKRRLVIFIK